MTTRTGLAALIIASLFLCATLAWILLDHTPPSWDDAYYLTKSLDLYDTLADKGIAKYATGFLSVMDSKPPLIAALPTPIYLVVGRKYRAAYAVNLLFLAMMFAAIYGIARNYSTACAGLIAVAVVGTIPVIYSLSHWYLVECGLVALVCAFLYLLTGWSDSSGTARAALLGITFGLGLLMKASFPVYVVIPLAYFVVRRKSAMLQSRPVVAFLVTTALLASPWYLMNARHVIGTALHAGSAETAKIYQTGSAASISDMASYLFNVAHSTPWLYLAALAALAVVGWSSVDRHTKRGLLFALLWMSPLVLLTASHYRDIRYAAPLYPAAALVFAWLADAAIRKHGAVVAIGVGAVLSLGCLSMFQNSFGSYDRTFQMGGLLLDERRLNYARGYDRSPWPQPDILTDLYRAGKSGGEKRSILLGTNSIKFNVDNFTLAAVQKKLPFEIDTTAYIKDAATATEAVNRATYFIYEEGGGRDQPNFNIFKEVAVKQARDSSRFVELPIYRALPDGGVAHVFAKIATSQRPPAAGAFLSAGLDEIPACKVTFADKLQLAGVSASRTASGIEVRYKWRCLKPMDRDYWCFTHVVDRNGKVIGYLDHRPLDGNPPTSQWKPGDTAVESRVFPVPDGDSGAYELHVGVYHRESGDRLSITESTFPLTQNNTASVIKVAAK
jgi:Dolichyl-phosphate-mannose-protein mannosyltransferase